MNAIEKAQAKRERRDGRALGSFARPTTHADRDGWQLQRAKRQALTQARINCVENLLQERRRRTKEKSE